MKNAARRRAKGPIGTVLKAAQFKAEALAVMRHVRETGQPVTVTSRGQAIVRIEPVRAESTRVGYGSMKGTVEFLVSDEELISAGGAEEWRTLQEWREAMKP